MLGALLAGLCLFMLGLLWMAERSGPRAQVEAARADTAASCQALQQSHRRLISAEATNDAMLLNIVTDLSLRDAVGIEGGVWDARRGFVAYAFPTHEGATRKLDVPEAEKPAIEALVRQVSPAQPALSAVQRGEREVGVLAACALPGAQVAWTFHRVSALQAQALQRLGALAAVALGGVVLAGGWLLLGLRRWGRRLGALEADLAARADDTQALAATGERDLDRLVQAFNASAARVSSLSAGSDRLTAQLAQAERMAALGRVAAGLAHEIRNPLGAMRLRAENALAVSGEAALARRTSALDHVLKAVGRLEALVDSLLALTRPMSPVRVPTVVAAWLQDAVALRDDEASRKQLTLTGECPPGLIAEFDPAALGRALDNLLQNAIQHTPSGGHVAVSARASGEHWHLSVDDDGPGVAPEVRSRLFEPFATGRADGTGLGLAIAHEIVAAHGGRLSSAERAEGEGARFEMELPWRAS